ncbi:MAG: methyltransferase domain-containing protein [Chloroflexi bacterium]|nr:methyltransferase domain-containing protein [Chloroflexota bacterium]
MEPRGISGLDDYGDPTELVAAGYDRVGERYTALAMQGNETKARHTNLILGRLPDGSDVLDLGCGSGQPTTAILARRFNVIGVELSSVQIERAREAVPNARFVQADMSRLELSLCSFDAVVAFYSIIHVPRARQQALFESIYSWLRPGGILVASLASTGSEIDIEENYLGAPMYWSSFDAETSRQMLRDAGLELERAELVTQTFDGVEERHLWVVARRPS